jgi:hypothetical protein
MLTSSMDPSSSHPLTAMPPAPATTLVRGSRRCGTSQQGSVWKAVGRRWAWERRGGVGYAHRRQAAGSDLVCMLYSVHTLHAVACTDNDLIAWSGAGPSFRSGLDPSSHIQCLMPCLAHDPRACRSEIRDQIGIRLALFWLKWQGLVTWGPIPCGMALMAEIQLCRQQREGRRPLDRATKRYTWHVLHRQRIFGKTTLRTWCGVGVCHPGDGGVYPFRQTCRLYA